MANEVLLSGLGDLSLSEIAAKELLLAAADRSSLGSHPALFYAGDIQAGRSATIQVSSAGILGYDLLGDAGENASLSNTAFTDASVSLSVARKATKYAVSELVSVTGADGEYFWDPEKMAANAIIVRDVKLRDMVCNIADGFTSTVGATGVNLTLDNVMAAKATVEAAGVPGPYLCILHPVQWNDLIASMRSEGALISVPEQMVSAAPGLGYKGHYLGIDFFVSTSVPTANSGADRAGALFGRGAIAWADATIPAKPFGLPTLNMGKAQVQYDESASSGMTDVVVSCYLGVGIAQDNGVSIITDA